MAFSLDISSLFAQKGEKQFGVGTGWFHHDFKDPSISSESNSGGSIPLLLFFRSNGEKSRHHIELSYCTPRLQSTYLLGREQTGYLQYAYHRKISLVKNKVFIYMGGVLDISGSRIRYSEIGNSYSYSYPFTTIESMGTGSLSTLIEIPIDKNKFCFQIWQTVIGRNLGDSKGWMSLNDFSNTRFRVSYIQHFGSGWDGRVDYLFSLGSTTKYPTYSVAHQLSFSLVCKLH